MPIRDRALSEYAEVRDSLQRVLEAKAGTSTGRLEGSGKSLNMDLSAQKVCKKLETVERLKKRLARLKP